MSITQPIDQAWRPTAAEALLGIEAGRDEALAVIAAAGLALPLNFDAWLGTNGLQAYDTADLSLGVSAQVADTDVGTHADEVTGDTVPNAGIYSLRAGGLWHWVRDNPEVTAAESAAAAALSADSAAADAESANSAKDTAVAAASTATAASSTSTAQATISTNAKIAAQQAAADAAMVSGVYVPIFASAPSIELATIPAAVKNIRTQYHDPVYPDLSSLAGGADWARVSAADIPAGTPAMAKRRSVDRCMPDGSTHATNGGWWLNISPKLRPEMFGRKDSAATTGAMLQAANDFAHLTHRPLVLSGTYTADTAVATAASIAQGGFAIEYEGDVVVNYTGTAVEYFWGFFSTAHAVYSVGMSGGTLTINGNLSIQRAFGISAASGSTTIGGECHVRGLRVNGVFAPAGSNGVAYAVDISGPFGAYTLDDIIVSDVSRHASLDATGDCKALRVTQARVPVRLRNSKFSLVLNPLQDADAVYIAGPIEGGLPVAPLAVILDCEFYGISVRSVKTQTRHTIIRRTSFNHGGLTTTTNSSDVGAQYGSLDIADCTLLVDAAPGSSYIPFATYGIYNDATKKSCLRRVKVTTGYILPRLLYNFGGANAPDHEILVEDCEVVGTDAFTTSVFSRCAVEFSLADVKASSKKLTIRCRRNTFQSSSALVGYVGGDGTDVSAKLGIHLERNKNPLALTSNSKLLSALSGTALTKLTDYTFGPNEGYIQHFPVWDANLATIKPGNDFTLDIATSVVTNGPANLPATGIARVLIGAGETTWFAYQAREIIVGNGDRHFYTLNGTWAEKNNRPMFENTATYDIASLALGATGAIQTITVTGAALGDFARASLSIDTAGVVLHAWVSAANTVKYFAHNLAGANPLDLASATVKVRVEK